MAGYGICVGLDLMEFACLEDIRLQRDGSKAIGIYLSNNPSKKKKKVSIKGHFCFFSTSKAISAFKIFQFVK